MTITAERPALWSSMPGWGIAADLIPPEVVNLRRLRVLRKFMAAGVVLLLLISAGGYYLAARTNSKAASDLVSVQDQTLQLQKDGRGYAGVIAIQGSVTQVQTQIAQLMVGDVDLVGLMNQIRNNLPKNMTINQEAITISTAGVASAAVGGASSGLDVSGLPRIGTITLSGTGKNLDDLSDYVDRLHAVTGLVDVLPLSNTTSGTAKSATAWSMTIGLTNAVLSHRFDVAPVKK